MRGGKFCVFCETIPTDDKRKRNSYRNTDPGGVYCNNCTEEKWLRCISLSYPNEISRLTQAGIAYFLKPCLRHMWLKRALSARISRSEDAQISTPDELSQLVKALEVSLNSRWTRVALFFLSFLSLLAADCGIPAFFGRSGQIS